MTSLFDRFFKFILEATSFVDLPNYIPYGFWISPSGEYFVVTSHHLNTGIELIKNNPKLRAHYLEFTKGRNSTLVYEFLGMLKYVRVVKEGSYLMADSFYYNENGKQVPFEISSAARKTIKDLGSFYNKEAVIMTK